MKKKQIAFCIVLIIVAALTVRIALFAGILARNPRGFFQIDSYGYWQTAENLIKYGEFSRSPKPPLLPDHRRTPLYPFFLAALIFIGLNATGIVFVQILLSTATCLLVIFLTYKLTNVWFSAFIAGVFVATDTPTAVLSNCLLTETLFTFLFVIAILLLVYYLKHNNRIFTFITSGILIGLSILCRPVAVLFPVSGTILILLFLKTSVIRKIAGALFFLLISYLVIAPWVIRNRLVFGEPFLCTVGHYNMLYYRAAGVYAEKYNISLTEAQTFLREKAESTFQGDKEQMIIEYKKFEGELGSSIIKDNMLLYIRTHAMSIFNMFFRPIRNTIEMQLGFVEQGTTLSTWGVHEDSSILSRLMRKTSMFTIALVVIQLLILIIFWFACAIGMMISLTKGKFILFSTIFMVVIYFCLLSGGPEAYARFRVPLIPFLAIASGVGLIEIYERLKSRMPKGEQKHQMN